jgi:hypothetical protein
MTEPRPERRICVSFTLDIKTPIAMLNFCSIGRPGRVCLIILRGGEYGDRQLRSLLQLEPQRILHAKARVGDSPEEGAYIYLFTLPAQHPVRLEHIEALWPQVIHAAGGLSDLEVHPGNAPSEST